MQHIFVNLYDVLHVLKALYEGSFHTRKQKKVSWHRVGWIRLVADLHHTQIWEQGLHWTYFWQLNFNEFTKSMRSVSSVCMTNFILSTEFRDTPYVIINPCLSVQTVAYPGDMQLPKHFTHFKITFTSINSWCIIFFLSTSVMNFSLLGQFWTDKPTQKIINLKVQCTDQKDTLKH